MAATGARTASRRGRPAPRTSAAEWAAAVPPGWRGTRRVLRGPLSRLVVGQALGQAADGLAQIAFAQLVLFDVRRGATPADIAGVLAATLLPFTLAGPFAGVLIDRWDRRVVLRAASWLRAGIALGAVAVTAARSVSLAYVGVLLLLSSSRFVLAAKGAALPTTVARAELVTANAVSSVAGMTAAFVGAVGGSLFVGASTAAGFLAAAGAYTAAGLVFGRLPPVGGGAARAELGTGLRRAMRELAEGGRVVARERAVRRPLATLWAYRLLLGAGFVLLVLVTDSRYDLEASGYGLALAVTGVGAFAGTLLAPILGRRCRPEAVLPLAFVPAGLAAFVAGYTPGLPVLVAGVGVAALCFQVLKVLTDALVGRAAPDVVRGRVFAAYDVIYNLAFVLAGLAMIPLWRVGRERALLWGLAAAFVLTWLVLARLQPAWPFSSPTAASSEAAGAAPARRWPARLGMLPVAALPVLAFPEPAVAELAWVALVPLLLLLRAAPTGREAAVRAWWAGAGFLLAMHYWLLPNLGPALVLFTGLLGALWAPWGAAAWALLAGPPTRRRLFAAVLVLPSGWALIEAARSASWLGGPWGLLGSSQWNRPAVLALAGLGGVWLLSALLVAANVALTVFAVAVGGGRGGGWTAAAAGGAALLVAASGPAYAAWRGPPPAVRPLRLAVIQPGVVAGPAARFDAGESLTQALRGRPLDLVVWGESSVGFDLDTRPDLQARLQDLSRAVGADLLVNVDAYGSGGGIRKVAVLVGPGGVRGRYTKMRLVPFGEYIPLRPALGWVARVSEAAREDRGRGGGIEVLRTGGFDVAPLICFESAFPDLARASAARGAQIVVYQSSTSTFQGSWAPGQHAALAAVRAVETGRPVVHATLTGRSAVYDARGRRLANLGTDRRGTLLLTVPVTVNRTPYLRLGDWVPAGAGIVVGLGVLAAGPAEGDGPTDGITD